MSQKKKVDPDYPNYKSLGYLDFHAVFDVLISKQEMDEMKYGEVKAIQNMLSVENIGKEIHMVKTFREEIKKVMEKKGITIPKTMVVKLE